MAMNPCLSACTSWPGSTLWPNTSTGSPHLDKSNFDNSFGIAVGLLLLVSCLWLNISTWLARSGRVQRKADVQLLWNPHQSSHPRLCWSNVRGWTKSKTFMEKKSVILSNSLKKISEDISGEWYLAAPDCTINDCANTAKCLVNRTVHLQIRISILLKYYFFNFWSE